MRTVDTKQYLDTVCQLLREGKTGLPVPVAGTSMCPFLHPGDTVYLDLPQRRLRRGDIVLFARPDGSYVLHRIYRVRPDGSFLLLGDGQQTPEPVPSVQRIFAIVTQVNRKGAPVKPGMPVWWFYGKVWPLLRPFRGLIGRILGWLRR